MNKMNKIYFPNEKKETNTLRTQSEQQYNMEKKNGKTYHYIFVNRVKIGENCSNPKLKRSVHVKSIPTRVCTALTNHYAFVPVIQ